MLLLNNYFCYANIVNISNLRAFNVWQCRYT